MRRVVRRTSTARSLERAVRAGEPGIKVETATGGRALRSVLCCVSVYLPRKQKMLVWFYLAAACCLAHAQPQYGGPVQFGPPPSNVGRGVPQHQQSAKNQQQPAFQLPRFVSSGPVFAAPQGFRPAPIHDGNDGNSLGSPTPAPVLIATPPSSTRGSTRGSPPQQSTYYSTPQYNAPSPTPSQPRRAPVPQQTKSTYQKAAPSNRGSQRAGPELEDEIDEDELEEQKPDRLTELLPHSKFSCGGKNTGYYADQDLACEVFHYCQDGAKHSWVCPDGFTFHQVHLICMPPSHDNICQQASEYFFVNDYLYRPLNAEEARTRPNVTLRYSDRYYPEHDPGLEPEQPTSHRAQPAASSRRQPAPPAPRNQVFHSPESVNIPLQQRRVPASPAPTRQQFDDDEYEYDDFPYRQQG